MEYIKLTKDLFRQMPDYDNIRNNPAQMRPFEQEFEEIALFNLEMIENGKENLDHSLSENKIFTQN